MKKKSIGLIFMTVLKMVTTLEKVEKLVQMTMPLLKVVVLTTA